MNKQTALLIVDVQVALFEHTIPLYRSNEILETIQILIKDARKKSIPVIYIQHTEPNGLFLKDSPTWAIHKEISPLNGDWIVEKHSWDSFFQTGLHKLLEQLSIKHLVVMGMQTEFCLDTTIRNGYSLGYSFTVCGDAHTTFSTNSLSAQEIIDHHNSIWHNRFAQVTSAKDFTFK